MMNKLDMIKARNGKPCIIDSEGTILIEPKIYVDALYYPSNGLCQVMKNRTYGYIDLKGKLVIPFEYREAYPFSENGLAFVIDDNGYGGYINTDGKFVIDPIYDTGSIFRFGFAAVSVNGEYTYIYNNGMKAINHTFNYASGFSECGLAKIQESNGQYGFMDTTSRPIITFKPGCELAEFKDGCRITKFRVNRKEALINAAGEIITGLAYDRIIISPYNRLHPFLRHGLWGYLDTSGNEVIPNIYKKASEFEKYKDLTIASVKSYHPLAENNIVHLYINEQDEIVDHRLIEDSKQPLKNKFSKVSNFKKALALAVQKT